MKHLGFDWESYEPGCGPNFILDFLVSMIILGLTLIVLSIEPVVYLASKRTKMALLIFIMNVCVLLCLYILSEINEVIALTGIGVFIVANVVKIVVIKRLGESLYKFSIIVNIVLGMMFAFLLYNMF